MILQLFSTGLVLAFPLLILSTLALPVKADGWCKSGQSPKSGCSILGSGSGGVQPFNPPRGDSPTQTRGAAGR